MRLVLRLSALLFVAACSAPAPQPTPPVMRGEPLPTFSLVDVNPASATNGQSVGPTTFRGKVSGWYFTHST